MEFLLGVPKRTRNQRSWWWFGNQRLEVENHGKCKIQIRRLFWQTILKNYIEYYCRMIVSCTMASRNIFCCHTNNWLELSLTEDDQGLHCQLFFQEALWRHVQCQFLFFTVETLIHGHKKGWEGSSQLLSLGRKWAQKNLANVSFLQTTCAIMAYHSR